jgi:hypothetical protein
LNLINYNRSFQSNSRTNWNWLNNNPLSNCPEINFNKEHVGLWECCLCFMAFQYADIIQCA